MFQADAASLLKPVERFGIWRLWQLQFYLHRRGVLRPKSREPLLLGGLKKLKRIAVRILNLDLFAPGPYFHLIAELQSDVSERLNTPGKVVHLKYDAVPSTGLLLTTIGHWPGA